MLPAVSALFTPRAGMKLRPISLARLNLYLPSLSAQRNHV